jgi:RND family efflux transporter MFP subunit
MKNILIFTILTTLFTACKHSDQAHGEHAHDAKLQLTAYSNAMELFAEADPFVIGINAGILAHFTWLDNFNPLDSSEVIVSLIIGNDVVSQKLSEAVRPGIYKFDIEPKVQGDGKLIFDIQSKKGNTQIIVNNIKVYEDEHEAHHTAEEIVVSETNTTVFTKEQSWKIEFETKNPSVQPFGQVIKTTAQILSSQGDELIVTAKAAGVVIFTKDNVQEGKTVSNGQTLFTINSNGLASDNTSVQYMETKNNYLKATAEYERAKELAKDKIVSAKDLLITKTAYENAKTNFDNMNRNFSASGQSIKSPMSGYVKQVFVQNGQSVAAGQALVSVSQNKTLQLRADVQQKYAPVLGQIKSANIRLLNDNQTYSLEQLNGKLISFGKSANNDNYLIPVIFQIDNKAGFVSGGFADIFITTITNKQAITIPNASLIEEQGLFFVFVQVHPELFEKREVKTGGTDGLNTEIKSGITGNDRIVTKGAMMIKLAQATGTLDAHSGHVH